MTPRASFVIPAYNADRWISKALYSCRNQTVKTIEIIVVNDGSTDSTKDILDFHEKEDKRIRVYHTENRGRSAARNFGNEAAQSDLILVLDADDMAARTRVNDTIATFQLKKPDLMYGSFFTVDSMGNTIQKIVSSPFDPEVSKEKKLNFICHSTMAYTKKLANEIKYSEGEWSRLGLDDWKFQWDAYRAGYKIKNVRNALSYYRLTDDNTMATRDQNEVNKMKETYLVEA